MRKLMLLAAMLALVLALAVPAIAQVSGEFGQELGDTGDFETALEISSTGNNSSQCVAPLQFGNTANVQNLQGFFQYASDGGDAEFESGGLVFEPSLALECEQSVEQAAAASSYGGYDDYHSGY